MIKRSITCMCGASFESEFPEELDASSPEILGDIIGGSFLTAVCETCGTLLRPDFPLRVTGLAGAPGGYGDILLLPELERDTFLLGKRDCSADRVVIGRAELIEKVSAYRAGLDDRVLEVLKFLLLEKMSAREDVRIYYVDSEPGEIRFQIFGLREKEVGVTRIPPDLYRKVEADLPERLKEEPFREILTPPYVSVSKISMEV